MELWKDIPGYEGLYQASTYGRIKSIKRNIIVTPRLHHKGYNIIRLSRNNVKKSYFIHRLMAIIFLPQDDLFRKCVNHKNGIKTDNRLKNLEMVSVQENNLHSYKKLGRKSKGNIKRKVFKIDIESGDVIKEYPSLSEAARDNNCKPYDIFDCCNGGLKSSHGYRWRYSE